MSNSTDTVHPVSRKAAQLVGSEIIRLAAEINALKADGAEIYNLTIGDFNPELFPIPQELEDEIVSAYRAKITNYPPSNGLPELRQAVSDYIRDMLGLDYHKDQYLISGGARPLIFAAYQAIVDPDDKVIFPIPSWNNNHYTHLSDGIKVAVETYPEHAFMPRAEDIAPHVKDATLVAVCSPLNPTGTVFPKDQLEAICDLVLEENKRRGPGAKPLYLLYDQIYWQLTYGDAVHYDPVSLRPEMKAYTVYIDGISKCFAATGVRVGWAFGPEVVIKKMKSILGHVGAWSPRAEQFATTQFLNNRSAVETFLTDMRAACQKRLFGFYEGFKALNAKGYKVDAIAPKGAIYLTLSLDLVGMTTTDGKVLENQEEVRKYVLEEAGLAVVPFYAFGGARDSYWYRLSIGTARVEEMDILLAKMDAALAKLS